MTRTQVAKMLAAMTGAWPSFTVDGARVEVWSSMLADVRSKTAVLALEALMARSTFPPSIAEFRRTAWEIETPASERLDEGAAWQMVNEAIDRVLGAQQRDHSAFYELPPKILACCREIGFSEIVNGDLDAVRGTFLRFYREAQGREREQGVLPARLREAIAGLPAGEEIKGLGAGFGIVEDDPASASQRRTKNEGVGA